LLGIEIVLGVGSVRAADAWGLVRSSIKPESSDVIGGPWKLRSRNLSLEQVEETLRRSKAEDFEVESVGVRITFASLTRFGIALVRVEHLAQGATAQGWIEPFWGVRGFRGARVFDEEYEFWQNAEDLLQYRTRGRRYEHLPLRSNGLPPPLEQTVVDTTRNPGRRVLRAGAVEAIGSEMWFGPEFWAIAGSDDAQVRSQTWLRSDHCGDALYLKAADKPFDSGEGESGALQERLRGLLFPKWSSSPT